MTTVMMAWSFQLLLLCASSAVVAASASTPPRHPFGVPHGGAAAAAASTAAATSFVKKKKKQKTTASLPLGRRENDDDTTTKLDADEVNANGDVASAPLPSIGADGDGGDNDAAEVYVTKRDGRKELLDREKLRRRLESLSSDLDRRHLSLSDLVASVAVGTYPSMSTSELDTLASETAASMSTRHPDYARLAARIAVSAMHKVTPPSFSEAVERLYEDGKGFIDGRLAELVRRRGKDIDSRIRHERDLELTYFGYKTLERAYLLKGTEDEGEGGERGRGQQQSRALVERPQYMWMRVALGIHCCRNRTTATEEQEDTNLEAAFETYDLMSRGLFSHATPTLFYSGTTHPQLSSCFLVQMSEDSINGIYDTLKRCAVISKSAGGIGLSVHNIRARGTHIKGTRGVSNGLVPMLRVYDVTSRYVDQGGGKRPGAFAVYLEPWHADVFDVLNLKKNHGKEEQRARNLFYGLWVPDLFMRRVRDDGVWSLMCPHKCPGLSQCHGSQFDELYAKYESQGKYVRQVRARELWAAILDAQIETGTPYMLYKDACNAKSNQRGLGTIQCSNLCTEIVQYTDEEEVAVCNLASICLPRFVVSDRGPHGSPSAFPSSTGGATAPAAYFDHAALHAATKTVTRNLNKIIDVNRYPTPGAAKSNLRHRPVGIGVSGLADAFVRLGLPFASREAKELNEAMFETIYHAALEASAELAAEEGTYESFGGSPASEGRLQFDLWGVKDDETPSRWRLSGSRSEDATTVTRTYQKYSDAVTESGGYDWSALRAKVIHTGLRNSLLVAPMPTASTSQILGVNECFEPYSSNLYLRRVKAGEFIVVNPHLLADLTDRGLWTPSVRNRLMRDGGSVANIECVPAELKELYKTVWEIKMKDVIDMAADRGKFVDQSQSLNLFLADPTVDKLTAMHFYAWKKGLKTGMYYLRTKPAVNAIQYTVKSTDDEEEEKEGSAASLSSLLPAANRQGADDGEGEGEEEVCLSCQA